ncbi:heart- and neural crest derivatives-expressed protein 2 [Dendroctonus ponderosae]|uniref:BHLH domain-containing protein n=1 Tax=Dendroctonus ponderosae TaxID=77166 RepID=A0AAR5NXH7_DENPD|nr:heart- and neural crest derivatives-expressed protein 2 [Dendroctonus ponderosae]KAH1023323.1 hypothetical protein HUJ04_012549 [Dendroctonus ponderosae]KAH1029780.1 hypothetical protein HUJ05_002954 [Dendroctonus ponderosae]
MSYSNSPPDLQQDVYQYGYHHGYHYISDGSTIGGDESNFWSNSPRSESPSPNILHSQNQLDNSYIYSNTGCPTPNHYSVYRTTMGGEGDLGPPFVRVVKRRTTANKKERRRTQSINNAYHDLKRIIPNVPMDTKLSKIKTLRLATAYISYLTRALETDDTPGTFKAELGSLSRKSSSSSSNSQQNIMNNSNNNNNTNCSSSHGSPKSESSEDSSNSRKAKGRTGWPQHVWALELKQEQAL